MHAGVRMDHVYSTRFDFALRFSAEKHDGQRRKGTRTPYVVHPVAVAFLLRSYGYSEDVQIAGLLHDVVEDTDCTPAELRESFGDVVADTVGWCTEQDKGLPWEERKAAMVARIHQAPREARAVATADKAHNLSTMLDGWESDGEAFWGRFSRGWEAQLQYYQNMLKALEDGFEEPVLEELRLAVARFEERTRTG